MKVLSRNGEDFFWAIGKRHSQNPHPRPFSYGEKGEKQVAGSVQPQVMNKSKRLRIT